jgi:hypothetical protein
LLGYHAAIEIAHCEPVGVGFVEHVIRRQKAPRSFHVFDDSGGVSRNVFADVASDGASVSIVTATGRVADDETDGLTRVKVFGGGFDRGKRKGKCKYPDADANQASCFFHGSLLFIGFLVYCLSGRRSSSHF